MQYELYGFRVVSTGISFSGGEVITTSYPFISTTHAIIRNNLKPVFCDIKLDDYTIEGGAVSFKDKKFWY